MRTFWALIIFSFLLATVSADSLVDMTKVSVEYHGAWQWFAQPQYVYKLTKTPADMLQSYNLNPDRQAFVFLDDGSSPATFSIDVDNVDRSYIAIRHFSHVYRVDFSRSPSASSKEVIISVNKDGQKCGAIGKTLAVTSIFSDLVVNDFVDSCGVSFAISWIRLSTRADIKISQIWFSQNEVMKNYKEATDAVISGNTAGIIQITNEMKNKFRVIEVNNINDFQSDPNKTVFIHPDTEFINKSDATGKENGVVVTENNKIKYLIYLKNQFTNEFDVRKPAKEINITDYSNYQDLKKDAILTWTSLPMQKVPNTLDGILKWGTIATVPLTTEVGTAYVVGQTASAAWLAASNASVAGSSLATSVMTGAAATEAAVGTYGVGVTGGSALSSGAITCISITPVGWVIIGVTAAVSTVYATYHFTNSESYAYDGGALIFNQDPEFWSGLGWGADAKINFLFIQKNPGSGVTVAPPTGSKHGNLYYRFDDAAIGVLKSKGISTSYADIVKVMSVKNGSQQIVVQAIKVNGMDTLKFENVDSGVDYSVIFSFDGFSQISQTWKLDEGDISAN